MDTESLRAELTVSTAGETGGSTMSKYSDLFEPILVGISPFGGDRILARCPFHNDLDPSFSVDLSTGLYFCFGCGEKGNHRTFSKKLDLGDIKKNPPTLDRFKKKLSHLRDQKNYEAPAESSISTLYPGVETWEEFRGVSTASVEKWELGYDPMNDALLIPVRASNRKPIGIIRRYLSAQPGQAKYKYPSGFPRKSTVYGAHLLQSNWTVITEGSLDTVSVDAIGFPSVAVLGSRVSDQQATILGKAGIKKVVIAFDNDEAGRTATQEASRTLRGFSRFYVSWGSRSAKDVDELSEDDRHSLITEAMANKK
ncbi:Bacterial DnaG primase, TOPRIM domain [uncultured Caudovirales phage]|uniref:Bacterial DnaG primase, TOPRIM domain n=1 Tax=uncultured Caudovirales phage TaxID=2100421 RepID=A0A6J5QAQ5_9CAUD|nr:Bacterial DnaG primase, TOPRIM domain [uncultured Caudovirales phage]